MKSKLIWLSLLIMGFVVGCSKSEDSPAYANLIKFGTSLDPTTGDLMGETNAFTLPTGAKEVTIAFYMESVEDFNGQGIVLDIRQCGDGGSGGMWSYNFQTDKNVGHEIAGTFPVAYAGQFCVVGKIGSKPPKVIAQGSFTVK